ncbi:hypothetical protein [Fischerella sp. NIES-3754]|uniref:hypothetical protein n=1 Tax=Fischerella sp. NIES-3754 TaxID=1752063 RepID=UPI003FA47656
MKETDMHNRTRDAQMQKTMQNKSGSGITDEDWFNLGKSDAWAGQPKIPPQQDSQAASMYELGYCEGEIKRAPIESQIQQHIQI